MSDWKSPAISTVGLEHERDQALIDARDIIRERGQVVKIRLHVEGKIERDEFNTIIKRDVVQTPGIDFYSFPVIFNPTDKQLEEAGIREKTEVLIKTSMLDWTDAGYTLDTLKDIDSVRATVIIGGAKYEIRDKALDSQYGDTYLYIHLGLNRI